MDIAFLGSSLLSSYWNGAATYYRGIIAALARRGCKVTFYEPDAFDRQKHRDIDPPPWARVVVYPATLDAAKSVCVEAARADIVIKASGIGVFDDEILNAVVAAAGPDKLRIFWDVDAPATLEQMAADAGHVLHDRLRDLELILTYGGGPPVVEAYTRFGAKRCELIYNALDPQTHFPVPPDPRFAADLAFLGNRLPDREARADQFFFKAARLLPGRQFLLGGSGWEQHRLPPNVRAIGHVSTRDHNAFNTTPLAVINIARDSMVATGYSPATRVFEAAGAGACLITDAWDGIEHFLEPGREVVVARDGAEVAAHVARLDPEHARLIGMRARERVIAEHTYDRRADKVIALLAELLPYKSRRKVA